jgi:hypothetical protein
MNSFSEVRFNLSWIPLVIAGALAAESQGALLVHEGFSDYEVGALAGVDASASSTGLTGKWAQSGSTHLVVAAGLTFEGLATQGGALSVGGGTTLSGIGLAATAVVAPGGTLYSSFLVRQNADATPSSSILTRIHNSSATESGGYFSSFADARENTQAAVGYDALWNPANSVAGSTPIAAGETYIVISSFTNVGNSTAGDARLYILNQSQYTNLLAAGINTLGSRQTGTGDGQVWGAATDLGRAGSGTFNDTDFLQIVTLSTNGFIDELRYGTTLADVLPVPEPSTSLLAGAALATLCLRRGRRPA